MNKHLLLFPILIIVSMIFLSSIINADDVDILLTEDAVSGNGEAAPILEEKAIAFGDANDKVVGNYPWFIYNNNTKTLAVQNLTVAESIAVGSAAVNVNNSPIYGFHEFYTNADNRLLTATMNQRVPTTSPNYPATLRFELNYRGGGVEAYRLAGIYGAVKVYGTDVGGVRGVQGSIQLKNESKIGSAMSFRGWNTITDGGNITTSVNYWASNTYSNGTIDTLVNFGAENTAVTAGKAFVRHQYVFYCPPITGVDDDWCLYQLGTSPSLFGGNVTTKNLSADLLFTKGIYFSPTRYFIWDALKERLYMRAPELINFQISDTVVSRVTYTSFDIQSGLPLKFYIGGKYTGFKPPAVPDDNVWTLPVEDVAGFWKSNGSGGLSIINPTYAEVKRTEVVTYLNMSATALDNIVPITPWADDPIVVFATQPMNVRNVQVIVVPNMAQIINGTVNITCIDSDGAVVYENFTFVTDAPLTQTGGKQCAIITLIAVDATAASGTGFYSIGLGDSIGIPNYPWGASTNIIKISKNGVYYSSINYAVDILNGTITDNNAIQQNDIYTIWYRPFS